MYIWISLVAQMVKCLPTMWETGVWPLDQEDPLEKEMATLFLPGKSHGQRSMVGYCTCGRKESDTTERLHFTLYIYIFIYLYIYIYIYIYITYRVYRLLYILCSATREATAVKVAPTSTPTRCFLECLFLRLSATIFSNFSIFFQCG